MYVHKIIVVLVYNHLCMLFVTYMYDLCTNNNYYTK